MRDRIISSAREQILKYGLRGFTMDDLVVHLSISKKTLYKYFRSKNELIGEIVRLTVEHERERTLEEVAKRDGWLQKLDVLLTIYTDNNIPYRVIDELYRYFPLESKMLNDAAEFREKISLELLREGITKGDIRTDVEPATILFALNKTIMTPTDPEVCRNPDITVNVLLEQMKKLLFYGILKRE